MYLRYTLDTGILLYCSVEYFLIDNNSLRRSGNLRCINVKLKKKKNITLSMYVSYCTFCNVNNILAIRDVTLKVL